MAKKPALRAAVVYNPTKVNVAKLRDTVAAQSNEAGWAESLWYETSVEDVGQEVTRQAIAEGADLVIAVGGDGTVRAVAESVRGTNTRMALLPSGTGNLLARNLNLTLGDMAHSLRVAFTGVDRAIDLGVIDIERDNGTRTRHVFLVMAGMGLDAKMIENTDDELKAKAGWIAYVTSLVTSLRDPNQLHLVFQLDDDTRKRTTLNTLILGNCGSLPGNVLLLPDAVVDDGLFDLLLMRPHGVLGWVRVWLDVLWVNRIRSRAKVGNALPALRKDNSGLRYQTGTRFVARLSRAEEIELDGDGFGKAVAFRAWIEPGALTIRVPAT